jgi:hypothetical protein
MQELRGNRLKTEVNGMADHGQVPMDSQYMDYAEHERTYQLFLRMTKWISIAVAVLLILMAAFLV